MQIGEKGMCKVIYRKTVVSKKPPRYDIVLTCKTSGKPITKTNEFGRFCEDFCDLEECKKKKAEMEAHKEVMDIINTYDTFRGDNDGYVGDD